MKPGVLTAQSPFEMERLVALYQQLDPQCVLEVGVWHGGTLWHWLQGGGHIVAIDDAMAEADDWIGWARESGADLTLIQGHSHSTEIVEAAAALGPYDFVFIDAEHTYEAVKGDWDRYHPLVARGGVVAFHDIKPRPGYGVSLLWDQLKTRPGARTVEFWQQSPYQANGLSDHDHGTNQGAPYDPGIGVIWL